LKTGKEKGFCFGTFVELHTITTVRPGQQSKEDLPTNGLDVCCSLQTHHQRQTYSAQTYDAQITILIL